jgi:acyl-CoA dehydrogenase
VLDWELATLGNPWADVAYLAMPYHLPAALASLSLIKPLPGQLGRFWVFSVKVV